MPSQRSDINVREIMAAGEDVTRTIIGNVLDAISVSAVERTQKWQDTDDAVRHLQRIRAAVNDGEELIWAVVDFWLQLLPAPDLHTMRAHVDEETFLALAEQGRSLGMTGEGFLTALAQKSAKDFNALVDAEVEEISPLKDALIVGSSPQQAEQFIIANAEAFTGWRIVTHIVGQPVQAIRGRSWHLAVYLTDASQRMRDDIAVGLRKGDAPTSVNAYDVLGRFDPAVVLEEQRLRNKGLA